LCCKKIFRNLQGEPLPELPLPNPFVVRIHVLDRQIMQQHLAYHFGLAFASAILSLPEPIVYPVVFNGRKWTCAIFVLTKMDLNEPLASFNIQFSIHNVKFQICTKRAACESLIRRLGEAGYKHILNSLEPLCLADVNTPQITILILF
jgi:hypothetical protein